jgi:phage/plasmid-like protein (TIGR03299 family)
MRNITTKDGIKLNGSIGEQTWQLLEASGLNWEVKKEPLFTGEGVRTESFGIIRQDSQTWIGTVGNKYSPFQNYELADTIVQASAGLGDQFRGGQIGTGDKVFLQLQLQDAFVGRDQIKRYITAINSHDGSTSIGFGSSNTVVVCQNTFFRAYKDLNKFRHTESAAHRIKLAAEQMNAAVLNDNELMEHYKRMEDIPVSVNYIAEAIRIVFNPKVGEVIQSTRKENQVKEFQNVLGKELASHGENLWGLFNAVTFYENHVRAKESNKDQAIMFGTGYNKMNQTFDQILEWVDARSHGYVSVI